MGEREYIRSVLASDIPLLLCRIEIVTALMCPPRNTSKAVANICGKGQAVYPDSDIIAQGELKKPSRNPCWAGSRNVGQPEYETRDPFFNLAVGFRLRYRDHAGHYAGGQS